MFALPLSRATKDRLANMPVRDIPVPDPDPSKPRILLVEDEATLREHLASTLSDRYVVDAAANGREALTAVMRAPPDLIVTDIVMPDIDGIELLKALRSPVAPRPFRSC